MGRKPHGYVAARSARRVPESTLTASLQHCITRLEHGLSLAKIAARGPEPEYAARYLVDALTAVRGDVRVLRVAARRAP